MFKNRTVLSLLMLLLCSLLGFGCEQRKEEQASNIEPQCISSQSTCLIRSASGDFSILFNRDPVTTETSFDIFLVLEGTQVIKKITAHMEGKNMFMGKVPLFFEFLPHENNNQDKNDLKLNHSKSKLIESHSVIKKKSYIANTMLGSCSEENMRWIIYFVLILETPQGGEITESFSIEFDSTRR